MYTLCTRIHTQIQIHAYYHMQWTFINKDEQIKKMETLTKMHSGRID